MVTALFNYYMAGATSNCCRLGARSVYIIQQCTSLQCHFIRSHKHRMHGCSAVNRHLHFWQNYDQNRLRATAVSRGWNGYQNKESAQKMDPGEESSLTASVGTGTQDLLISSPAIYHRAVRVQIQPKWFEPSRN